MKTSGKWIFSFLFLIGIKSNGQNCPPNIGFENGTFSGWQCSAGRILRDGTLDLSPTGPIDGRHTLFAAGQGGIDPWGGFPINCPNGSKYSIRLGNSSAGGEAEGISYTFSIPATENEFSLIFNYAVVFQNPPHQPWEQPRFTSKVFNVTDNKYIQCGTFQFVAASNIPGFYMSTDSVFYKPWTPVTVNFSGLAGKTVRLEFTTNDCAFVRHFGYAYIDVNEDCSQSPISGTVYCNGASSVTLTAPFGFASYRWFNADFSQVLGTGNVLTISPPPPANTNYQVEITPFPDQGCADTLLATIVVSSEPFTFNLPDSLVGCATGVDLTDPSLMSRNTPGMVYSYYTDPSQVEYLANPSNITQSGTYYIKAENKTGCTDIKPIRVIIKSAPNVAINNPPATCSPALVDLTSPAIVAGSEKGLTFTYWKDISATSPLSNANAIDKSGIYYIKADNNLGCSIVKPVTVVIGTMPTLVLHDITSCQKADLTIPFITFGTTPGLTFTYFSDAAATIPIPDPTSISVSGTYYIKAASDSGCSLVKPVRVSVDPNPSFTVTAPAPVTYPVTTVDITTSVNHNIGLTYSYWLDSLTRTPVLRPTAVNKRGRYYIRATNEFGCSSVEGVNVIIIPPPSPIVFIPNAFSPNSDGINDQFLVKIIGETSINHFRIYNRWGQVVYDDPDLNHHWNGKLKGVDMPAGVYVWMLDGLDTYFQKPFKEKGMITLLR